jgi:hypothetical protein
LFSGKEPTREDLLREVVSGLVKTLTRPSEFLADLALAEGQTMDSALAEWYAVMTSAMTYAILVSLGSQEKISPILDAFQPAFLKTLTPGCREVFRKIANARGADYIKGIHAALDSGDVSQRIQLSSLMARRITGHYDASMGLPVFKGPDIITITALWTLVNKEITITKEYFDNLQQHLPSLFSRPVT